MNVRLVIEIDGKAVGFMPMLPITSDENVERIKAEMIAEEQPKQAEEPKKPRKSKKTITEMVDEGKAIIVKTPEPEQPSAKQEATQKVEAPQPAPTPTPAPANEMGAKVTAILKEKGGMTFPNIQKALGISGADGMKELYNALKTTPSIKFEMGVYVIGG